MRKNKHNSFYLNQQRRIEMLEEMGSHLRQLREQKSLSLEHMAKMTGIKLRQLRAIEEGKLDRLPEPVYIKYFIQRYADALGLDGQEFASSFPTDVVLGQMFPSWIRLPNPQLRPIHLYLLYVFLIFVSVNSLSYYMRRLARDVPTPPPVAVQLTEAAVVNPLPQQSVSASLADRDTERVKVSLKIDADSWVRIEADGKTEFEGILQKGTQQTWEAKQELIIRAGNAGGVLITLDDGKTKKLGEPGAVEEVTFKVNPKS